MTAYGLLPSTYMVQTSHKVNACCVYHVHTYVCVYMSICVLRGHACNHTNSQANLSVVAILMQ